MRGGFDGKVVWRDLPLLHSRPTPGNILGPDWSIYHEGLRSFQLHQDSAQHPLTSVPSHLPGSDPSLKPLATIGLTPVSPKSASHCEQISSRRGPNPATHGPMHVCARGERGLFPFSPDDAMLKRLMLVTQSSRVDVLHVANRNALGSPRTSLHFQPTGLSQRTALCWSLPCDPCRSLQHCEH